MLDNLTENSGKYEGGLGHKVKNTPLKGSPFLPPMITLILCIDKLSTYFLSVKHVDEVAKSDRQNL